jgi:hypothetical protein
MKCFMGIRRIIQLMVETRTRPAQEVPKLVKNAVVALVRKGILEASKASSALTAGKRRGASWRKRKEARHERSGLAGGARMDRNEHAA